MADQVNIENVGGDQGIASEVTLQRLLVTMELLANKTGADSTIAIKKAKEQYKKSIRDLDKQTKESTKTQEESTKTRKKAKKSVDEFAESIDDVTETFLGQLVGSTLKLGEALVSDGKSLTDFAENLPVIGSYLKVFSQFIDTTIDTFRTLSSVGAGFGNDLTMLRTQAAEAGLTLSEFGALISSNAETLRFLGGTVSQGVNSFMALNKVFKQTGNFDSLARLGFSVEEINEGLLGYVELQGRLGRIQRMDTQQQSEGAAAYLKQLDLLAKATGRSRKEIEETMKGQATDAAFRQLEKNFKAGSQELENFRASMTLIDSLPAELATGFRDLADGVAQTAEGQRLLAAAGPEVQEAMMAVAKGADPQILINSFKNAGTNLEEFADGFGAEGIAALRESQPVLAALLDQATQLQKAGDLNLDQLRKEQAMADKESASLLQFENSIRDLRESIQTALIRSGVLDTLTQGFAGLADIVDSIPKDAVTGFFDSLKSTVKDWVEWTDGSGAGMIVGAIVAAIGAAAVVAIPRIITKGLGAMLGGGLGMFGFGGDDDDDDKKKKGRGRSRGGKGGLLAGLGAGAGRLISGLAAGFKMAGRASVAIVKGASAIAIAIGVIGGAIAGVAWLTGKALPTFTEGLSGFGELDGDALIDSAKGIAAFGAAMAAFGAAMAAFGAGSLIGSVSSGVGAIADGLAGLTGNSMMDRLKEFGSHKINQSNVLNNAAALKAFGEALGSVPAIGPSAGSFVEGLSSLFGTSTIERLEEFSEAKIKSDAVIKNAKAMAMFGKAFQSLAQADISGVDIDFGVISGIENLSEINGSRLSETAIGMKDIAEIRGFESKMTSLKGLDAGEVENYTDALKELVETLQELNDAMAGDRGLLASTPDTTAGDVVTQLKDQFGKTDVNSGNMLRILQEIRDINRRTLEAVRKNSNTLY